MRKLLGGAMSAAAVFAIGMVGTASAQVGATCPTNVERAQATTAPISLNTPGWDVAGSLGGVGYGQADVNTTTLGYSGTLNGSAIGYGDIDGQVIGGPSGSADGELNGVGTASGSLNGTTLAVQTDTVATACISISTP
jgi:hypothetical protein